MESEMELASEFMIANFRFSRPSVSCLSVCLQGEHDVGYDTGVAEPCVL